MSKTPNVCFVRPEVTALWDEYILIRDALAGEVAVKAAKTKYLPKPNAADKSPENEERYKALLARAVFYSVSRRTLAGLLGQIFAVDPVVKIPKVLERLQADATGTGLGLTQLSKKNCGFTIAYSRGGYFTDFPDVAGGASVADIQNGVVRPTIFSYSALEIINWRTKEIGAEEVLSLVVLVELYCIEDDGFEVKNALQLRVLKLESGFYTHEIYREVSPTLVDCYKLPKGKFKLFSKTYPKGPRGESLTRIPFYFTGSENNDPLPDTPSFYDLASLNMAHYRNSADYEEAVHWIAQPTLVLTGLTESWVKDVLKGEANVGSKSGIALPVGGDAKLLEASEKTMIKEAMDTKEKQMASLGAKWVEKEKVERTATEASIDAAIESSVLQTVAKNNSEALQKALQHAAFLLGSSEVVEFSLNTDFEISRLTAEDQRMYVENWTKGATSWKEMRNGLRRAGQATEDDDKVKAENQADKEKALETEQKFSPKQPISVQ
jgi:Domain of unknown function (DUF4055)